MEMARLGLRRRGRLIDTSPGAHEALDVAAVPAWAKSRSAASFSGVATRVSARTLAYGIAPRAIVALTIGSVARAWATRTFSRAAPSAIPVRQCNQCAHDAKPPSQPVRSSNSCSSTSSSWWRRGAVPPARRSPRRARRSKWAAAWWRTRSWRRVRHREWRWSYRHPRIAVICRVEIGRRAPNSAQSLSPLGRGAIARPKSIWQPGDPSRRRRRLFAGRARKPVKRISRVQIGGAGASFRDTHADGGAGPGNRHQGQIHCTSWPTAAR